jgi:hypothetical protein
VASRRADCWPVALGKSDAILPDQISPSTCCS